MADESLSAVPAELATPASPPPDTQAEEPTNLETDLETPEEIAPEEPAEEFDDYEHEGKAYKVPKALSGHLMRDKDYTQSKQKLAEDRRALETRQAEIEERSKITDEELDLRAELKALDKQLAEYGKLSREDWAHHRALDPARADAAFQDMLLLREQRKGLADSLKAKEAQRTETAQSELTKRVQDTLEHAKKNISGFNEKTVPELVDFLQQLGIPDETIKRNWSPVMLDLAHMAKIRKAVLEKQKTAPKLPQTKVAPLETVGGKSSPSTSVDLASADMEAYVAARKRGVGGKALR